MSDKDGGELDFERKTLAATVQACANRLKAWIPSAQDIHNWKEQGRRRLRELKARSEYKADNVLTIAGAAASRYSGWLVGLGIAILCCMPVFLSHALEVQVANYFGDNARWESFKVVLITVGAALLGATAIGFSFVIFAMQVNVERMPHGLFRKFTGDFRLMLMFGATFVLVVAVPSLALVPDHTWGALALFYGMAGSLLVPILLILSYRRAIALINPIEQLRYIWRDAERGLRIWAKRATRSIPLMPIAEVGKRADPGTAHDLGRTAFFQLYPHWTQPAFRSLRYAIAFSRRYAEAGDYETSSGALNTILRINASYVAAKGKTFYANNPFFVNPLSADAFINETLEALRQSAQIAVSRGDEQQIEQTIKALAALAQLYASIDYADAAASPHHAQLAAVYLAEAVQSVMPHKMADVAMRGVRLLGSVAITILVSTQDPTETTSIADRIGTMGVAGALDSKFHPITLEAIRQLAGLTMAILKTKSSDARFALETIDASISAIARLFLNVANDTGLSTHSTYLAPYFSGTSLDTFQKVLTDFINAILRAEKDNDDAKAAIANLEEWSDGLYRNAKDLLLLSIEKKSHFAFDLIHWISGISKLLIAVTGAPSCSEDARDDILGHVEWLISALAWIPNTKEATSTGQNYYVHRELFETGWEAIHRGVHDYRPEFIERIWTLLLDWGLRETQFVTGWAILEHSIMACAVLALATDSGPMLQNSLRVKLAGIAVKEPEHLNRGARNLRQRAKSLRKNPYNLDPIERAMENAPRAEMEALLIELANIISPHTKDEPVKSRLF